MGKHSKIAKEEEEAFSLAPTECPIPMKTKKMEPTMKTEMELELKVEINLVLEFREMVVGVELFRVLRVVKQEEKEKEKERDVEDRKSWEQNSFLLFLGPSSFH